MIQRVKELPEQLKLESFVVGKALHEGEIEVIDPADGKRVPAAVRECAQLGTNIAGAGIGGQVGNGVALTVLQGCDVAAGSGISRGVDDGAVAGRIAVLIRVDGTLYRRVLGAFQSVDGCDLPVSNHVPGKPVGVLEERHIIDRTNSEPMPAIQSGGSPVHAQVWCTGRFLESETPGKAIG